MNEDRVVRLYEEGYTQKEVGDTVGCTRSNVGRILRQNNVETRSNKVDLPMDKVREKRENGASLRELAREYEVGKDTIRRRLYGRD